MLHLIIIFILIVFVSFCVYDLHKSFKKADEETAEYQKKLFDYLDLIYKKLH